MKSHPPMKSRVASLLLGFAFIAAPVFAQGPPGGIPGGGAIQSLANDIAALSARVAKLEGNIVASDLAGTYSLVGLDTSMTGAHLPTSPATIITLGFRASLTLNAPPVGSAGGTGSISAIACEGSRLTQGVWSVTAAGDCSESGSDVTWTYAGGVLTVTFLSDGDEIPFVVGLGGRFAIQAYAPFHASDPSSDQFLFILTRLK